MSPMPTYRRGDSGTAVAEIRGRLARLGLTEADVADPHTFDDALDVAVRTFQQQRGITVDGIVGATTYRLLDEARWRVGDRILSYTVSRPLAGDDVATLQRRLSEMGFNAGRVDGIFGPQTEAALREFQRNMGLVDDGTCGPHTFRELDRLARTVTGGRPHALREETALRRRGPALSGKVIIVDPGHGGADRGVVVDGLAEADLVEDLAARIEGRLTVTGVTAFPTRRAEYVDESERAAVANAAGADLVISLHCDAHTSERAHGVATYFYGNDRYGHSSAIGERFAELVQDEIVARTGMLDCRTHGRTWDLLRFTKMPTVRVEVGYLTSPDDAERWGDSAFRDTVAEAVVAAVEKLFQPVDLGPETGELRLAELVRG